MTEELLDRRHQLIQVQREIIGEGIQPVARLQMELHRPVRLHILHPERHHHHALSNRRVHLLQHMLGSIGGPRKHQHHDSGLLDAFDDRFRPDGPDGHIPRGDPAGDPMSLQRVDHRQGGFDVMTGVRDEHLVRRAWYHGRPNQEAGDGRETRHPTPSFPRPWRRLPPRRAHLTGAVPRDSHPKGEPRPGRSEWERLGHGVVLAVTSEVFPPETGPARLSIRGGRTARLTGDTGSAPPQHCLPTGTRWQVALTGVRPTPLRRRPRQVP